MGNLERGYCLNLDCLSNYFNSENTVIPKIVYDKDGNLHCEICGHTSRNVDFLPTRSLLSKSRRLEQNV